MLEDPLTHEEKKQERCYWRRVGFIAFFLILIIGFLLVFPKKAHSALNYRAQGINGQVAGLRLSEAPCLYEKVLKHLKAEFHQRFKAAILTYGGRDWQSCYTEFEAVNEAGRSEVFIFSIDEEGAPFNPVPKRLFREDAI